MQLNSAYHVRYGVDRWYAAGKRTHQWDCVQCACFYTHNPHTPVLGATQVAQRLWSTQHPGRTKQGQTGKALQIFKSSVQCGVSALFNRVCISFVQRATYKMKICIMISSVRNSFLLCVYSVCYIRRVIIHFPYLAQIIYVSLAYVYSEYMCVFIHPSVHVTVHGWTYPGAYTATLLALTIHFLFVGSHLFWGLQQLCEGDSDTISQRERPYAVKSELYMSVHVLLSIMNRLYLDIVSAHNANKHTFSAVAHWTLVVL